MAIRNWALVIVLTLGPMVAGAQNPDPAPRISDAQVIVHETRVRLMLDVAPVPAYTLFTLRQPDRLVVDFPAIEWAVPSDSLSATPYFERVRWGLFRHDRARIVFDLTEPLLVEQVFTRPADGNEPGRLVIDLVVAERAAFDARAGVPEQARWLGRAPMPPTAGPDEIIIAIDPGHGGIDPGASEGGLVEKEVVLEFSRALKAAIDARPGLRAYLIRDHDEFVPLRERVNRAHRARAHALLSIHADSVKSGNPDGVSIYTLAEQASDRADRALAARENRSDILAGADLEGETDDLARLLIELARRGTRDESEKLAGALLTTLQGSIDLLESRPMRRANFQVLRAPDLPSVLLELGFLDNEKDRERLQDPVWQQRAASAVAAGLSAWRKRASPGFVTPRE